MTEYALSKNVFNVNPGRLETVMPKIRACVGLRGKKVMDVGCASGEYLAYFLEEGAASAIGVDLSEKSISVARRLHPAARFIAGDYMTTELPHRMDVVFSEGALQCFDEPLSRILQKIRRDSEDKAEIIFTHARWTVKSFLALTARRFLRVVAGMTGEKTAIRLAAWVWKSRWTEDFLAQRMVYLENLPRLLTRGAIVRALRASGFEPVRMETLPCTSVFQADHYFIHARKS